MTVRKPVAIPTQAPKSVDDFIRGAPGFHEAPAPVPTSGPIEVTPAMIAKLPRNKRGHKLVTTIGLAPETIARIDAVAAGLGLSRTAWITMTVNQALKK